MIKVQLHFHRSIFDKAHGCFQDVDIETIPSKGDIFKYGESYFNELSEEKKNEFLEKYLDVGYYYVLDIKGYTENDKLADYIIFLAYNLN